jgi:hypothetical protein
VLVFYIVAAGLMYLASRKLEADWVEEGQH